MASVTLAPRLLSPSTAQVEWPSISWEFLPDHLIGILALEPNLTLSSDGNLLLLSPDRTVQGTVPLIQTQWNLEHRRLRDRLYRHIPWGIALHWFGDREGRLDDIDGYMRGFNDLRVIAGELSRTSAHFLVGEGKTALDLPKSGSPFGVVQTQLPDTDGTPFLAAHLLPIDYQAYRDQQQYFVKALQTLRFNEPGTSSLVLDMYESFKIDPNMRTIAIEITGHDFDNSDSAPSRQQVANVLSLVWALMQRYNIPATHVLGHNEVQLGKADPGKKFMALMRYLVAAKALVQDDARMKHLVFGHWLPFAANPTEAVRKHFKHIRDFLSLVGTPRQVFAWEIETGFWQVFDRISGVASLATASRHTFMPFSSQPIYRGDRFLDPTNHEGDDLYRTEKHASSAKTAVRLPADGRCIYFGRITSHLHNDKTTAFRHRLPNGAEMVTVFGHMGSLGDLKVGAYYPSGYQLGVLESEHPLHEQFLHFAVAYGATWEIDLRNKPVIPANAGATWIQDRFVNPVDFLNNLSQITDRNNRRRVHFE